MRMNSSLTNKKLKLGIIGLGIILIIAGIVALIGINNPSNTELQKVRVQAGWLLNGEFAEVCTAINNGYYKDAGLDVELLPGGPVGANFIVATNAIAQDNSIDIAIDGDIIPLLRGIAKDKPEDRLKLKAFASFWNDNPYGFLVKKGSGINSIADFIKPKADGSKVRLGLTADAVVQYAIAEDLGVDVSDLNIIKTGFDATPLISSQVDVLGAYWTTQAYELEVANIPYDFISASEIKGFNQPSMVAIASENTIKERSGMLEKWLRATIKGAEAVIANPELAASQILDPRCGGPSFNREQELWLINKSIPLFDKSQIGRIDEDQITSFIHTYFGIKQIERQPSYNEIVDSSILNKIYN